MSLTTLSAVKLYTGIEDEDALLSALIVAASAKIEAICDRVFAATDYRERINFDGRRRVGLTHRPIISVTRIATGDDEAMRIDHTGDSIRATVTVTPTSVMLTKVDEDGIATTNVVQFADERSIKAVVAAIDALDGWSASLTANAPSGTLNPQVYDATTATVSATYASDTLADYVIDYQTGIIALKSGEHPNTWVPPSEFTRHRPRGFQSMLVEYRAGYATIPADLEEIANEFVKMMHAEAKVNPVLQSERLGDYSYALAGRVDLGAALRSRLAAWERIR